MVNSGEQWRRSSPQRPPPSNVGLSAMFTGGSQLSGLRYPFYAKYDPRVLLDPGSLWGHLEPLSKGEQHY